MRDGRRDIRRRRGDARPAVLFEDERWTWDEHARASATRATLALGRRRAGPLHVGFLLENVPELSFWLGAGAVSGAAMVGINPTRRGEELATDIRHTDCQLVVTEQKFVGLLDGLDIGLERDRVLVVDTDAYRSTLEEFATSSFPDARVPGDGRRCWCSRRGRRARRRPQSSRRNGWRVTGAH